MPAPPRVRLPGPGDVKTIDARAIIRTEPEGGASNLEPNYLAVVEIAICPTSPGCSHRRARTGDRLQPWICLIVVPDGRGVTLTQPAGARQSCSLPPSSTLLRSCRIFQSNEIPGLTHRSPVLISQPLP